MIFSDLYERVITLLKLANIRVPIVIIMAITIFSVPNLNFEFLATLVKNTPTMTAVKYPSLSPTTLTG